MAAYEAKHRKAIFQGIVWSIFLFVACSEVETKWTRRFDALGPGSYRINSITTAKEAIYLTGTYAEQNSSSKCFLAKCAADGELEWHAVFQTTETTHAQGRALLIMRKQEELLTTHSDLCLLIETHDEKELKKAVLAKYDTLGNLAWQKTVTASEGTLASNLLYDTDGNLYVAGWEEDKEGKPTIFIAKYSEYGDVLYAIKYYSEGLDFNDLKFDIVGPECFVLAGMLISTNELFYIKYDSSGQFQAMVKYDTEKKVKALSDLKISPSGYVFMSADISNPETGDDFMALAYNPGDSLLWAEEYDGEAHGNDHSKAISVDESLSVYITGSTANAEGIPNIATLKYDIAGNRIWTQSIIQKEASEPLIMEPRYLRLGEKPHQAYLYITGTVAEEALILRCNTNGVYSFRAQYGERGKETVPTALSGKYMAFERKTGTGSDAFIVKYGPSTILGVARWD